MKVIYIKTHTATFVFEIEMAHCNLTVSRNGRVVKTANCESTGHGFDSTPTPLVICIRTLNSL